MDAIGGIDHADTAALAAAIWGVRNEDPEQDGYSTFTEITDHLGPQAFDNTPTYPGLSAGNAGDIRTRNLTAEDLDYIYARLTPTSTVDTTPPEITVLGPNGGEILSANHAAAITWNASDASGIATVDIYVSFDGGLSFSPVAYLTGTAATSGSYTWFPANMPTTQALVEIIVQDNATNTNSDTSDAVFTIEAEDAALVPTTARDFKMPGTQPLDNHMTPLQNPADCGACHGGYDAAVEPYHNWQGSMMAMSSRDFLFEALLVIANQDAQDSGDLCLRCHISRGWLDGRSTPPDGSAILEEDKIGVTCNLCHRMVDPIHDAGIDPAEDVQILADTETVPTTFASANYVVDPYESRRGPFADADLGHDIVVSPFHTSSDLCGTCHNVSNPAFRKAPGGLPGDEYEAGPLDVGPTPAEMAPETAFPVERTWSEWQHSAFNTPAGVHRPEFAGAKPDGFVRTCRQTYWSTRSCGHKPASPR